MTPLRRSTKQGHINITYLQEDLSVSDTNDIGGNVGGHISGLGLDDGKGCETSSSKLGVHLTGTLKQTTVKVEDISGVGLTTGGAPQEETHLTVGDGLLTQIIVEDDSMLSVVTEVFSHGSTSVGGEELKGGGIGGSSSNNDAVGHSTVLVKLTDQLGDGGPLLSDSNVDTGQGIGLGLLVDDGVDGNGSLSGLLISDDKLTLSTSNGDEGVDGLKAGKHGLADGLTGDDTGGLDLTKTPGALLQAGTAIDGYTKAVDDAAEKLGPDGNVDNSTGTLDGVALKDIAIVSKDHNSNIGLLKVEGHAAETAGKDNHLSGLDLLQTVDTGDTISDTDDLSHLGVRSRGVKALSRGNLGLEVVGEFNHLG